MDSNKFMKLIKFIGLLAGTTLLFATQMNVFASENDFELPVSTYDFLNSVDNTQEMLDRAGMVCRLYIPDCDINTALFNVTGMKNVEKQPIVDSADSGLWQESTDVVVVGDHAYEGFSTIKDAIPGETVMYLQVGTEIQEFVCAEVGLGCNTTKKLTDMEGNSLTVSPGHAILAYACADATGDHIYYAYWDPVSDGSSDIAAEG